jgi:hypothetical protein
MIRISSESLQVAGRRSAATLPYTVRRSLLLPSLLAPLAVAASLLGACSADPPGDDAESAEQGVASGVNVLTSRNDLARTGANPKEKVLTHANVNGASFGRVWSRPVDGAVYAQPLYVGGVNGKNVVYVATEHDSVYAFDADDPRANAAPLWQKNLGPSVPAQDTGCGLLTPEVGITATPVIDTTSKTMWLTARTKRGGQFFHELHALDLATGAPRPGSPVVITAKANGTGATSVNGIITFDPLRQHSRPGLTKVGNRIYLAFASLCDISPYHGWVLGYDATTLEQKAVHITTPNGGEGGIWQGGVALPADENGDLYYAAGDVYPDVPTASPFNGANNLGDSLVRLNATSTGTGLSVATSFTPFDTRQWSPRDLSLSTIGPILIPGTQLVVTANKRGIVYVVDRNDMGGSADQDAQIVQKFQGAARGVWGGAAYYRKGAGGIYYLWGPGDRLKAFRFDGQRFLLPALTNASTLTGYPGGQMSISSDGERPGTAILWTVRGKRTSPGLSAAAGPGVLEAFDAEDVTRRLYSSDTMNGDAVGSIAKFAPPTIANGRVYVGTASNELVAYGLRAGTPQPVADAGAPDASDGGADAPAADGGARPTWTQIYTQLLGPNTPGHCSGTGGCHTTARGGFACGTSKAECYQGLVASGQITPGNPAQSPLGIPGQSALVWLGGGMPLDDASDDPAAAAAVKAWVAAGAPND